MKWVAISGSWRNVNDTLIADVKEVVRRTLGEGNGIVAGGALGVDYIATQTVLEEGDVSKQLKIYLPIPLDDFCAHYRKRAGENVITGQQAEAITRQLMSVRDESPNSILDSTPYKEANVESYYARNTQIIESCDSLFAFQVNDGKGTQDAIDKARKLGKEVTVKNYTI